MGKYLTREEAFNYDGWRVQCEIGETSITDGRIRVADLVGKRRVFICQSKRDGNKPDDGNLLGYRHTWVWDEDVEHVQLINDEGEMSMSNTPLNVAEELKLLDLEEDQRLLKEFGIVDDKGDVTDEGKAVLWRLILADHTTDLVTRLKKLKESKKASEKSKKA